MKKDYKRFNKSIIFSLLTVLLFFSVFNFIIDPFNVFNNQNILNTTKPSLNRQERLTKMIRLKSQPDTENIIIGTSRADFAISDVYMTQITKKKTLNLAMQGLNFNELEYILKRSVEELPNLKTVLVSIDYDFFCSPEENKKVSDALYPKGFIDSYFPILFSVDSLHQSFLTMIKSLNPKYKKGFYADGRKKIFYNTNVERSFKGTIEQYKDVGKEENFDSFETLKRLISLLEEKGITPIFYIQPTHSTMYEIIRQNGAEEKLYRFKSRLVKITPYYDFNYPSVYSNESIKPDMKYFFESSHCTYIVGNEIIDTIFSGKKGFGYKIEKQSDVDMVHLIYKNKLDKWEKDNNVWMKIIYNTVRSK